MSVTFKFKEQQLRYVADEADERAVEAPIAFDFLAKLKDSNEVCEIGNVLSKYEAQFDVDIKARRIVDSSELLELSAEEKYDAIVSISTVQHIGLAGPHDKPLEKRDLHGPLKAIARIYELLKRGGKALITVPFGKFVDDGSFIQFDADYLNLIDDKTDIQPEAISVSYLKRKEAEGHAWVEAEPEELANVEYGVPLPGANAIVIIELEKE